MSEFLLLLLLLIMILLLIRACRGTVLEGSGARSGSRAGEESLVVG
jgi:hypothetical protein